MKIAKAGCSKRSYIPPPRKKMEAAVSVIAISRIDGLMVTIFQYVFCIKWESDVACFLACLVTFFNPVIVYDFPVSSFKHSFFPKLWKGSYFESFIVAPMYKKVMQQLLFELMKNSKRSDRELAKVLRVSQPTVTRMRKKLEEKAIAEYTIIPHWGELGFELLAVTFVNIRGGSKSREEQKKTLEKCKKWMMDHSSVIFASDGIGMGMDGMMISFHKDYTDYSKFITEQRIEWADTLGEVKSFIVSVKGGEVLKPFSLKYLGKLFSA